MLRDLTQSREIAADSGGLCLALRQRSCSSSFVIPLIMLLLPSPVLAQDTRAGAIAAQQAEKATRLAPQQRHWAEELVLTVQKTLVQQPSGFYPYFDSVYSGGGFTLGAGYRQFTGDRTHVNVAGLYSVPGYKLIEVERLLARSLVGTSRSARQCRLA